MTHQIRRIRKKRSLSLFQDAKGLTLTVKVFFCMHNLLLLLSLFIIYSSLQGCPALFFYLNLGIKTTKWLLVETKKKNKK